MEKRKENRNLKVYRSTTGYKRKETPMIMLNIMAQLSRQKSKVFIMN